MPLLVVGVGGALGAIARYLATEWLRNVAGATFPWGTFAVNVAGSIALGFAMIWLQSFSSSSQLRQLVAIGFLGSFTTFSTFSYEALILARAGDGARAVAYVAGSVVLGVGGVALGIVAAGALART
ncbi:MAG: fluoride efflux transporter CrcB [Longimicrobiales bacterium]|nr:fluoride efflux transporter CrcB [Longimicrobiales bacterium]